MRRWFQFRLSTMLTVVVLVAQQATIVGMAIQLRTLEDRCQESLRIQQETYRLLTSRAQQRSASGEAAVAP